MTPLNKMRFHNATIVHCVNSRVIRPLMPHIYEITSNRTLCKLYIRSPKSTPHIRFNFYREGEQSLKKESLYRYGNQGYSGLRELKKLISVVKTLKILLCCYQITAFLYKVSTERRKLMKCTKTTTASSTYTRPRAWPVWVPPTCSSRIPVSLCLSQKEQSF